MEDTAFQIERGLEQPKNTPRALAIFVHDLKRSSPPDAATRIALSLLQQDIAVFHVCYDGANDAGDLVNMLADAPARVGITEPTILIGHGAGGGVVLDAASKLESTAAVVTIGVPMPADPKALRSLSKPLFVLHAEADEVVSFEQSTQLYGDAAQPKSFLSLGAADHRLTKKQDADYTAQTIGGWVGRHLEAPTPETHDGHQQGPVRVWSTAYHYTQEVDTGRYRFLSDEPEDVGGDSMGPNPYDMVLAALGSCTSMTLRMYAERKQWPLESVTVRLSHRRIHAKDCADCLQETGMIDEVERKIWITGELDETQRARLMEIADKCPVHKTLSQSTKIRTRPGD